MKRFFLVIFICFLSSFPLLLQSNPHAESKDYFNNSTPMGFDSLNVRFVGNWPFGWGSSVIFDASRNLIYSASGGGVYILDGGDPSNPIAVSNLLRTRGYVTALSYDEALHRLYVSIRNIGLEIWDVSNPTSPSRLGVFETTNRSMDIAHTGSLVFISIGEEGLLVIDVFDPANPVKIGDIDTPWYAGDIFALDSMIYIADNDSGFRIIDATIPTNPQEIGFYNSDSIKVVAVHVQDSLAYLSAAEGNTQGLYILNISNPLNPQKIGLCALLNMPLSIVVVGSYVYLRDSRLRIIDVSDPINPQHIGSCDVYGSKGLFVFDSLAFACSKMLEIIDVSYPQMPKRIGSFDTRGVSKYAIFVADSFAYTVDDNGDFWVLDISDPSSVEDIGSCTTHTHNQYIDIFKQDRYAYVVSGWGTAVFSIIDLGNPTQPRVVGSTTTPCNPSGIHVIDTLAFITDTDRLRIYNVADPTNPFGIGSCQITGEAFRVFVENNLAYIASYIEGLKVVDVTIPTNPQIVGACNIMGENTDIYIQGTYAYMSSTYHGLSVIDISTPTNPLEVGSLSIDGYSVVVSGTYAFISDFPNIHVVDISDPTNPTEVGYYETPSGSYPCNLGVKDNYIFKACWECGIQVYEFLAAGIQEKPDLRHKTKNIRLRCHPNPFITLTTIILPNIGHRAKSIELHIYSVSGRKVREISLLPFNFSLDVTWDGRDEAGKVVPPGIYFLKLNGKPIGKVVKVR